MTTNIRPKVVIVGAGFGGLAAARYLAHAPLDLTIIDQRNYHLFQPLLYQVATAGLSPGDIAWPIRSLVRHQSNTRVLLGRVTDIDVSTYNVKMENQRVPYDYLILATGARHDYFGNDHWEPFAPGLKNIEDATAIRRRILIAFERAETTQDLTERQHLLTFIIVGAGPTGVELAGAIAELARKALAADFRTIDPRSARVILVEAGPRVLSVFPESQSTFTVHSLQRLGVEVRLSAAVTECDAAGVRLAGERIPAATILWAAGVRASPAAQWLGVAHDKAGRVRVNADLSVPGFPNVFAIGDTAAIIDSKGQRLPGVAPAAKQAGRYVGKCILARISDRPTPPLFTYSHMGNLATIGRTSAVIDFGRVRLRGWLAWWLWGIAHIYFLISMRNRLIVAIQWLWSYIKFERGARLITGTDSMHR